MLSFGFDISSCGGNCFSGEGVRNAGKELPDGQSFYEFH